MFEIEDKRLRLISLKTYKKNLDRLKIRSDSSRNEHLINPD